MSTQKHGVKSMFNKKTEGKSKKHEKAIYIYIYPYFFGLFLVVIFDTFGLTNWRGGKNGWHLRP